jgi:hypothetical protein
VEENEKHVDYGEVVLLRSTHFQKGKAGDRFVLVRTNSLCRPPRRNLDGVAAGDAANPWRYCTRVFRFYPTFEAITDYSYVPTINCFPGALEYTPWEVKQLHGARRSLPQGFSVEELCSVQGIMPERYYNKDEALNTRSEMACQLLADRNLHPALPPELVLRRDKWLLSLGPGRQGYSAAELREQCATESRGFFRPGRNSNKTEMVTWLVANQLKTFRASYVEE